MNHTFEKTSRKISILRLGDRITIYQLQELKQLFEELKEKLGEERKLIIDFSRLLFMDPLALGIIVAFSKEFREKGGELRIVNVNDDLQHIFEESRLSRVYEIYANVEQAKTSFV